MVAIATVRAANAAKAAAASAEPNGRPYVAVFAGGTSGIGERAVRALASNHGPSAGPSRRPLRAYIIGRKQSVADALIAVCAEACGPGGEFVFIKTEDLAMLRDVDAACAEIARLEEAASAREGHEAKIDLLVATQGVLYFGGRMDTSEGLDRHFSLMYYSRLRLVTNLLPLLTSLPSGSSSSTPGHVISVFNPNLEGKLAASDLSLRRAENFGFVALSSHIALFTTFAFEALAARHPGRLALSHYYPGFVMTDIASKSPIPRWASLAWKLCTPVVKLFAVGDDDCGQYVDFLASGRYAAARGGDQVEAAAAGDSLEVAVGADGEVGSGAYRVHWNGDIIQPKKQTDAYRRDGMVEKVWEHTLAAFAAVDAGKAFDG